MHAMIVSGGLGALGGWFLRALVEAREKKPIVKQVTDVVLERGPKGVAQAVKHTQEEVIRRPCIPVKFQFVST